MARKSKSALAAEAAEAAEAAVGAVGAEATDALGAAATASLHLPAELTIYTVGELHPQWLGWLHAEPADDCCAVVEGQAVEQVDAAGMQMLLALSTSLAARGRPLLLKAPSDALRSGCDALGLGPWLQKLSSPVAGAAS